MVGIIVDTSVFIEKIRTREGLLDKLVLESESGKCELYTSAIVLTELWMGQSMNFKQPVEDVNTLLIPMRIMTIDGEIGRKAGELIRKKQVEGFDALIAATALVHKAKLATLNTKHFVKVKGLKLYGLKN